MSEINKKRLVIWGVIFVILLLIGGGGYALNYAGYGSEGKIRAEVTKYIEKFNNLEQVRTMNKSADKSAKAGLSSDGIAVEYKNGKIKVKVNFKFVEENGIKYLQTTYNSSDTSYEEVVKLMIDAVGVENGNMEGKIFQSFDYNDFYSTQLAQGIKLKKVNNTIDAKINLNANILGIATADGGGEETISYILVDDSTKDISNYITYTVPTKFTKSGNKYELSTDTNTCTASFRVLSSDTAANSSALVDTISKADSTTSETQSLGGKDWFRINSPSTQGGIANRFIVDADDGSILLFEYASMFGNDECDEYIDPIANSIKLK